MYTFSKQLWGLHSPSTCSVQNFQIFTGGHGIKYFILTLSTHVSGFTLHTVIWFTLSKHMLGSRFSNFHGIFFPFILTLSTHISGFTLHTVIWFTLSKHMLGSKFSNFHERSFFHPYTLHTCFRIHSPYSYLVYTLQAHVKFKIFKFSREIIFSYLHSPHMFQGSLSIQLFGLHSPGTC